MASIQYLFLSILAIISTFIVHKSRAMRTSIPLEPIEVMPLPPVSLSIRSLSTSSSPASVSQPSSPRPSPLPSIVVVAQQLSLIDPIPDVDGLNAACAKVTVTSPLQSCLKRSRLTSIATRKKNVRFVTLPGNQNIDVCGFKTFKIPRGARLTPVVKDDDRKDENYPKCYPSIPGRKDLRFYPDGSIELLKAIGIFNPPKEPVKLRPRCKSLRLYIPCQFCRRPLSELNRWHLDEDSGLPASTSVTNPQSRPMPKFT